MSNNFISDNTYPLSSVLLNFLFIMLKNFKHSNFLNHTNHPPTRSWSIFTIKI